MSTPSKKAAAAAFSACRRQVPSGFLWFGAGEAAQGCSMRLRRD